MDMDEFSDDGLDDLPDNALQELENNAIQFTQAQAQVQSQRTIPSQDIQPEYSDYGWEEDDDLDTTEVTNDVGVPVGRSVDKFQQPQPPQQQPPRRPIPPVPNPRWNPVINTAERTGLTTAARPGSGLPGAGLVARPNLAIGSQRFPSQTSGIGRPQPSQFTRPPVPQSHMAPSQASQGSQAQPNDILSALQKRVRALEGELNAARGEASIIRTNATKAQEQHDVEVQRLKKLTADQLAKQERLAEAAITAEKTASTELEFLQRDMREVNDRTRTKDVGRGLSGTTTPRKTAKNRSFADGFDEMDIASSPSKGQGRTKNVGSIAFNVGERTPTKGKRKRPLIDSPVMPLEIHTDDVTMSEEKPASSQQPSGIITAPAPPFEFLQLIFDHGSYHQQPPTFDVLSRFSFPSEPTVSFASIIFHRLPLMGNPHKPMQLLVDFTEFIGAIWARCFDEQLWEPIKYLVALISFTFQLHTTSVAPLVIKALTPIAQTTIYTIAEWRHRLPDGDLSKNEEYSFVDAHVDTTEVLSLLHTLALACGTNTMPPDSGASECQAVDFWRLMGVEFVMLVLAPKQKLSDVIRMLDLLATSSLPDSIGPLTDEKEPDFVARLIIERVSAKLTEFPRSVTTPKQKWMVRTAALRTLIAFARHPFGAMQLASHDNAIPRLVTCLSASIDELYDQPIPANILPPPPDDSVVELTSSALLHRIISQCVLLIHALVTDPRTANAADTGPKLSTSHGGSQRYLLSLGRLTFAEEDLVMESGIESETLEMAHELLELAVTPDEGEIVSEAFGVAP